MPLLGTAGGTRGDLADVTEQIAQQTGFVSCSRCGTCDGGDIAAGRFVECLDVFDKPGIVEINGDDLPIEHFRKAHWHIFSRLADVVPNLVIEGADIGWWAEKFANVVAGREADFHLIELFGPWKVAAQGLVGSASDDT